MILEKAPASLKGELSRWLIEPKAGVFVGNPSSRVRDEIWARAAGRIGEGSVLQIWSDHSSPQDYRYRCAGRPERGLIDLEGTALVRRAPRARRAGPAPEGPDAGDTPQMLAPPH